MTMMEGLYYHGEEREETQPTTTMRGQEEPAAKKTMTVMKVSGASRQMTGEIQMGEATRTRMMKRRRCMSYVSIPGVDGRRDVQMRMMRWSSSVEALEIVPAGTRKRIQLVGPSDDERRVLICSEQGIIQADPITVHIVRLPL